MPNQKILPLFHARNEVDQLCKEYCFDRASGHCCEAHNQVDTGQLLVLDGVLLLLRRAY